MVENRSRLRTKSERGHFGLRQAITRRRLTPPPSGLLRNRLAALASVVGFPGLAVGTIGLKPIGKLLHKILAVAHFVAQNAAKAAQNTPF